MGKLIVSQLQWAVILLGLFYLVVTVLLDIEYEFSDSLPEKMSEIEKMLASESGFLENCSPPQRFVFLKKHKCASSSFQNVFNNFQKAFGLPTLTPLFGSYGGGYPSRMKPSFFASPIDLTRYSIKCHHRLNLPLQLSIFAGAKFFTSLREPFATFHSSYNFHYSRFSTTKRIEARECNTACWSEPFRTFLGGRLDVSLSAYLDELDGVFDQTVPWSFRSKNFQAFELGLDPFNDSQAYLDEEIAKLDDAFHLVMLQEYFFESLVLLSRELCVDYRLLFVNFRMTTSNDYASREEFSKSQMATFEKHFAQDLAIYDHFNRTFWSRVADFGFENMRVEKTKLEFVFEECNLNPELCQFPVSKSMKSTVDDVSQPSVSELLFTMKSAGGWCPDGVQKEMYAGRPTNCTQLDRGP